MANSGTIKNININSIRNILDSNKSMTKSDIARYTGLSFPTVSNTIEYLLEKGEVIDCGLKDSSGGRCAKNYSLNPMYLVSLSLYLEGFEIYWFITDHCGNKIQDGRKNCKNKILKCIEDTIISMKLNYSQLASIMIGIASNINSGKITSHMEYEELYDIDVIKYLKDKYEIPINVENDMKVAARGYWARHENKDIQAVASIYMGKMEWDLIWLLTVRYGVGHLILLVKYTIFQLTVIVKNTLCMNLMILTLILFNIMAK